MFNLEFIRIQTDIERPVRHPYDDHTLGAVIEETQALTDVEVELRHGLSGPQRAQALARLPLRPEAWRPQPDFCASQRLNLNPKAIAF